MTSFKAITELPFGLPGAVFRSPLPYGAFDTRQTALQEWHEAGVKVVYSLIQAHEWEEKARVDVRPLLQAAGIQRVDYPIEDFWVPREPAEFQAMAVEALRVSGEGSPIAIHCNAGWGRTGLFITEMAIQHFGFDVHRAVTWIRQFVPPAVENTDQYQFLLNLHPAE